MVLIQIPPGGARIVPDLAIPDNPIIPFIEGDGIGMDITPVMRDVTDAAVQKAYGGERNIHWMEVYCGEKAAKLYGNETYLPQETLDALKEYVVSIKGPLAPPPHGGIRSLDVALHRQLGLRICQRPVRGIRDVPSLLEQPDLVDMVVFSENSEDTCSGVEQEESAPADKIIARLQSAMRGDQGCSSDSAVDAAPVSRERIERLVRKAIEYAIDNNRKSVTLFHSGDAVKFADGPRCRWGFELAMREFGGIGIDDGRWLQLPNGIVIKDVVADAFLQQILLRPAEHDVIATLIQNGAYLSDALAAEVGSLGITPGASLSDDTACFEAALGALPQLAGQDKVNPGSIILAAEMMLRHLGWREAADLVLRGVESTIGDKIVTHDLARLMNGAQAVSCSAFGRAIVAHM